MASNLMPEERKPPDTDSEDNGKCSITIKYVLFSSYLYFDKSTLSKKFEQFYMYMIRTEF